MKKVLIVCDLFPPAFGPRMGYLTKYLKAFGWEAVVITEQLEDQTFAFMANECRVESVNFYENKKFRKLRWFFVFMGELLFKYKNRKLYQLALNLLKEEDFDLILSSSYRSFPLWAAAKASKKSGLPLVIDIRDIIEQYTGNEFITQPIPNIPVIKDLICSVFKQTSLKERNNALRAADHLVTVSPWHVSVLSAYNPNTSLIYNGYDPELFYPVHQKTDKFIISYTGRLLSLAMRNPELLLKAMSRLADENLISTSDFRVEWYVDSASEQILKEVCAKYKLSDFMDFMGYVPASKIPEVLNKSSILLALTNKADDKGPKGVMTTKFFEFLAVEKPILCVRSDEDCLEQVIKDTNSGLAARNEQEVYEFILRLYLNWKKTGQTSINIDKEKIQAFSRKGQALQFIRIFESVIEKHS